MNHWEIITDNLKKPVGVEAVSQARITRAENFGSWATLTRASAAHRLRLCRALLPSGVIDLLRAGVLGVVLVSAASFTGLTNGDSPGYQKVKIERKQKQSQQS